MTANCLLSVFDINNVTDSRKCNIVLFLIAADLFSSYENIHYVGLCN